MSDIPVTLAAGSLRPAGASGNNAGSGETAVRVVDPSPDLARLDTGESLRGTVVGKDDHGHLLVRTRLGVLTLAVPRPLPTGTEVVLQVRTVGPQVILTLLPLDSTAANAGVQQSQGPQVPAAPAHTSPPPPPAGDLVQRGQLVRAVLHTAPPMPALAGLPTAQPGTELAVRILSLGVQSSQVAPTAASPGAVTGSMPAPGSTAPSGGVAPTPAAVQPTLGSAPPAGAPATPPAAAQTGSAPPGSLPGAVGGPPAGTVVSAPSGPVAAAQPPGQPIPSAAADGPGNVAPGLRLAPQAPVATSGHSLATALQNLSADVAAKAAGSLPAPSLHGANPAAATSPGAGSLRVTALVTAATSGGQPILHTPLGTLTLDTRAALPPGTSLALDIALPAEGRPTSALQGLAAAWPGLESLEETLFQGLPAAQSEAIARALPQVGPRLASGLLFFLSALNQGNVAGWLTKAGAPAESEDRGDLVQRLGREFAGLSRTIETSAGEWRFVNLPLWSDQGLRELRCFFRHQEHGRNGRGDGEKATRFVLELELSRHGELQLDGLVRARLFDLVLRSRRPLPSLVRGDLLALFEETNAIAGYGGRLSFQASQDWMQLLAARSAPQPHEGLRV